MAYFECLLTRLKPLAERTCFSQAGILKDLIAADVILDARVHDITVRMLLRHKGGWDRTVSPDWMFEYGAAAATMNIEQGADARRVTCLDMMFYALTEQMLDFDPGSNGAYSNLGYCILGRVIEALTGLSYSQAVAEHILTPAGIPGSEFYIGEALLDHVPGHEAEYSCYKDDTTEPCSNQVRAHSVFPESPFVTSPYGAFSLETMDSHGGWVTTPRALLKFMKAVFPPHCGSEDQSPCLLSDSSVAEILDVSDGYAYGLGFSVNEWGNYWHTGALSGTASILVMANTGNAWAVVFNKRDGVGGFTGNYDALMWDAVGCVESWPSAFSSAQEATALPPVDFDGWSTKTNRGQPLVFEAVPGAGFCQDKDFNEGRNRRISWVALAANCEAACSQDALCVGYASHSAGGDCVVYTDEESDEVHPGFSWIAGTPAVDFVITQAGNCGSGCWDTAVCRKPSEVQPTDAPAPSPAAAAETEADGAQPTESNVPAPSPGTEGNDGTAGTDGTAGRGPTMEQVEAGCPDEIALCDDCPRPPGAVKRF
jgi:CubicO group peptidase (beta-lactamase class C family)